MKALLVYGARLNEKDRWGMKPLDYLELYYQGEDKIREYHTAVKELKEAEEAWINRRMVQEMSRLFEDSQ